MRKAIRFPNLQLILFFVVKSQRTFPQNSQVEQGKQYSSLLKYDCDDKLLGCRDTNLPVAAIDRGTPWKIDSIAPQIGQNVMNFSDKVVIRESNKTIPQKATHSLTSNESVKLSKRSK